MLASLSFDRKVPEGLSVPAVAGRIDARTSQYLFAGDLRLDDTPVLMDALGIPQPVRAEISDADLVALAYAKWGADCAEFLLGDFAFFLFDQDKKTIFAARDPRGVKSLYFATDRGTWVFGHCQKDVLETLDRSGGASPNLDLAAVASIAWNRPRAADRSVFEGLSRLPAGHAMVVDATGQRTFAHWRPQDCPDVRYPREQDYIDQLLHLLETSVRDRAKDTPDLGAHMTGGLDSSTIAVLASRLLAPKGRTLPTYCWSNGSDAAAIDDTIGEHDERHLLAALRDEAGLEAQGIALADDDLFDSARFFLRPLDNLNSQFCHEDKLRRVAKKTGTRVLLSGWGADECVTFNGRGAFAGWFASGRWDRLAYETLARARVHGAHLIPITLKEAISPSLPFKRFQEARPKNGQNSPRRLTWLTEDWRATLKQNYTPPEGFNRHPIATRPMQETLLTNGHITERIESWAIEGRAVGIDYRYPFLDRRLLEFSLGLPPELSFKNGWKRYLIRTATKGILPDPVRWCKIKNDPARMANLAAHEAQLAKQVFRPLAARLAEANIPLAAIHRDTLLGAAAGDPINRSAFVFAINLEQTLNPEVGLIVDQFLYRPAGIAGA